MNFQPDYIARLQAAIRFLLLLYPEEPLPGKLGIWTLQDKKTHYHDNVTDAASTAIRLSDKQDVYLCVGLRREGLTTYQRGAAEDVIAIPGLWMDLDIQGSVHKQTRLPPTLAEALAVLAECPFPPALNVFSGYGIQSYWLFKEPWTLETDQERQQAEERLSRVQAHVQAAAEAHGWLLDNTADLARVLRVPGTFNHKQKQEPALVAVLNDDGTLQV